MNSQMAQEKAENRLGLIYCYINSKFKVDNNDIYHYTTSESLMGILQKEKICFWFSKHDCLNDCSEGKEMIEHYKNACKELKDNKKINKFFYDNISNLKPRNLISFFSKKNNTTTKVESLDYDAYICCFSKDNDSLGLWRYYAKNNKYEGYNIGCKSEIFEKKINDVWFGNNKEKYNLSNLKKVIYDDEEKKKHYKDTIINCYESYELGLSLKRISLFLSDVLLETQLLFKHKCFESEKEVRAIMYIPKEKSGYDIKYRIRNGIIVPYIEVTVENKKHLSDITIAPLLNDEIAKVNLEQYLNANGYKNIEVKNSKLPIRF